MRRSKDFGKRQKMESHDHRTPVGRKVGVMESIGQDRNECDCEDFHKRDE